MGITNEIINIDGKTYRKVTILQEIQIDESIATIDKQILDLEKEKTDLSTIKEAIVL